MKQVIVIDDENNARENLIQLIEQHCPGIRIIGEADGVESGVKLIKELKPDAIFLDIAMQDGSGFDLLDRLDQINFKVIFQTAFDEFAVKAFRYNAVDYLLKPVAISDLQMAVEKIEETAPTPDFTQQLSSLLELARKKTFERIVLNSSEGMHFVEIEDILRLQSDVNYTTFFLISGEKITVTKTIKTFEEILPADAFFRPHQSHIVHLKYVKKVLREDGGYALMEDNTKVPISRSKKEPFITLLKESASSA